jgi:hypothetical protein
VVQLLGVNLPGSPASAGSRLSLKLFWQLDQSTSADLKRFVHLLGPAKPDGTTLYAQQDSDPCDNAYPTWRWKPGEVLIERVKMDLPADVPPGSYQVSTGWYDSGNLQRLMATNATGQALGSEIELGSIQVSAQQ